MPESAAGNDDARRDLQLRRAEPVGAVAERLRAPRDIASSESEATVGMSMQPMTRPAESALKMLDLDPEVAAGLGVKNVRAK